MCIRRCLLLSGCCAVETLNCLWAVFLVPDNLGSGEQSLKLLRPSLGAHFAKGFRSLRYRIGRCVGRIADNLEVYAVILQVFTFCGPCNPRIVFGLCPVEPRGFVVVTPGQVVADGGALACGFIAGGPYCFFSLLLFQAAATGEVLPPVCKRGLIASHKPVRGPVDCAADCHHAAASKEDADA